MSDGILDVHIKGYEVYFDGRLIGEVLDAYDDEDFEMKCYGGPPIEERTGKKILTLCLRVDELPESSAARIKESIQELIIEARTKYRKIDLE